MNTLSPGPAGRTLPSARRIAIAMARSKLEPCFRMDAGASETVSDACGQEIALLATAALTRSRDSVRPVSGRPMRLNRERPAVSTASACTRMPESPSNATAAARP